MESAGYGVFTQLVDCKSLLPEGSIIVGGQQEDTLSTALASLQSPRSYAEIHSILILACTPMRGQETMFPHGVATALLWQLGKIGLPTGVSQATDGPSRGRVASAFHLVADEEAMSSRIWQWSLRGMIAGLGWLIGLGDTDDLRELIENPQLARQRYASLPVMDDPWGEQTAPNTMPGASLH